MSSDLNKEEIPVFNSRKRPLNLRIVCGRLYMGVDCKVIMTVKGWEIRTLAKLQRPNCCPKVQTYHL